MGNVTTVDMTTFSSSSAINTLNLNIQKLTAEFDKVIYKDGHEEMTGPLDMNGQRIYNLPAPVDLNDPVRLQDLDPNLNINITLQGIAYPSATVSALRTLGNTAVDGQTSYLMEIKRSGAFVWSAGDKTSQILADPSQGIYVPAAGDPSGVTGAWVRVLNDEINLNWFGVAGDGTTDDTTKIQNAINLSAALGRSLLIPTTLTGYKVTAALNVQGDIRGFGYSSLIVQDTQDSKLFNVVANNTTISGIRFKGKGGTTSILPELNGGVFLDGYQNIKITDCYFHHFEGSAIFLKNFHNAIITNNFVWDCVWNNATEYSSNGAIHLYSFNPSGRIIISDNMLFDDMSQSISGNILTFDTDLLISNNVICTMESDLSAEKASGTMHARHGILLTYNGNAASPSTRGVVNGNLIRNKLLTCVYAQTSDGNSGAISITSNVVSKAGLVGANSLAGNIHVFACTNGVLVADNFSFDYRGTLNGSITVNGAITGGFAAGVTVVNNYIKDSLYEGIFLNGRIRNWVVRGNTIVGSTRTDITVSYIGGAGETELGGAVITDNFITRTNANFPGIVVTMSGGVVPRMSQIQNNKFYGFDRAVTADTNSAIRFITAAHALCFNISGNVFERWRNGVYCAGYFTAATRYTNIWCDRNHFINIENGIVAAATVTTTVVPLEGNTFDNVTNRVTGAPLLGQTAGYEVLRRTTNFEIEVSAIPTAGTWIQGDRARNKAVTAGQPKGWSYSGAAWLTEGNY